MAELVRSKLERASLILRNLYENGFSQSEVSQSEEEQELSRQADNHVSGECFQRLIQVSEKLSDMAHLISVSKPSESFDYGDNHQNNDLLQDSIERHVLDDNAAFRVPIASAPRNIDSIDLLDNSNLYFQDYDFDHSSMNDSHKRLDIQLSAESIATGFEAIGRLLSSESIETSPTASSCQWSSPKVSIAFVDYGPEISSGSTTSPAKRSRIPCKSYPAYRYTNNPTNGWTKYVTVDMQPSKSGKKPGQTRVFYQPPFYKETKLYCRRDLLKYMQTHAVPRRMRSLISFEEVFCLCHRPEDENTCYIECSYGLTGCFGWVRAFPPLSPSSLSPSPSLIGFGILF